MQATLTQPNHPAAGASGLTLRPTAKFVGKAAFAVLAAGNLMALAYYVLPGLSATGPAAYALGFVINAVTSASIIVPVPGMGALVVMSSELNPWMLAAVAAFGGALGEMFGYWLGSQGRGTLAGSRFFQALAMRMRRHGAALVFLFAAVPVLPMDAAAMVAGATHYPVARFVMSMAAGKAVLLASAFATAGWILN
jgi:membrane protein YqaA with SNARE-associated domain